MARPAQGIEVEWQFVVRDVDAFRRWLLRVSLAPYSMERSAVLHLHDSYFDTTDWRLHHAGYALRVRRSGKQVEATMKELRPTRRGVARRREITERLSDARAATLRASRGAVSRRLRLLVGSGSLRRLFSLRTRRCTYIVNHRGRPVAELALDRTVISAPHRRSRRIQRVELEVKGSRASAVASLAAMLHRTRRLTNARRSKFEEGLRAARLVPK
jgi:inorganic triphosphatase YgiF